MNLLLKYLTFFPAFRAYMKGGMLFYDGHYSAALTKFEKCLNHPKFQDELVFSYYGLTLCQLSRLDEGYEYLLKACRQFDKTGWVFENEITLNLAQNTLVTLEHILKHTKFTEGAEYLDNELKLKKNS